MIKKNEFENLEIEHSDYAQLFGEETGDSIFNSFEKIKKQIIEDLKDETNK